MTPHLGLLVSGGNTILFSLQADGRIEPLASTVDDAAGEALDKGAKLLGLGYPGGPAIEKLARQGDPRAFDFPRAFPGRADRKFSFSGLKTSLRYRLEKLADQELEARLSDLCASYQEAVIEALVKKTGQILQAGDFKSMGLSGGVSNNRRLRDAFHQLASGAKLPFYQARLEHTGDNAGMIAFAAYADPRAGEGEQGIDITLHPSRQLVKA